MTDVLNMLMGASSVTGVGHGAADKNSPHNVKHDRLLGPFAPRILMAGTANMTGGEVTINHPPLPDGYVDKSISVAISYSAYPVYVTAYNATSITVNSLETGSTITFVWMILAAGVSNDLSFDV